MQLAWEAAFSAVKKMTIQPDLPAAWTGLLGTHVMILHETILMTTTSSVQMHFYPVMDKWCPWNHVRVWKGVKDHLLDQKNVKTLRNGNLAASQQAQQCGLALAIWANKAISAARCDGALRVLQQNLALGSDCQVLYLQKTQYLSNQTEEGASVCGEKLHARPCSVDCRAVVF